VSRGEPQLEAVETVQVALPAEPSTVPLEPASAGPIAVPYGARGPEGLGGMRDVMAMSSPLERRRFILQLQRTAGNAAVCRWLGAVRERYAAKQTASSPMALAATGDGDVPELDAAPGGGTPPEGPPEDGPRAR
jgi:hypothetical protein